MTREKEIERQKAREAKATRRHFEGAMSLGYRHAETDKPLDYRHKGTGFRKGKYSHAR